MIDQDTLQNQYWLNQELYSHPLWVAVAPMPAIITIAPTRNSEEFPSAIAGQNNASNTQKKTIPIDTTNKLTNDLVFSGIAKRGSLP